MNKYLLLIIMYIPTVIVCLLIGIIAYLLPDDTGKIISILGSLIGFILGSITMIKWMNICEEREYNK